MCLESVKAYHIGSGYVEMFLKFHNDKDTAQDELARRVKDLVHAHFGDIQVDKVKGYVDRPTPGQACGAYTIGHPDCPEVLLSTPIQHALPQGMVTRIVDVLVYGLMQAVPCGTRAEARRMLSGLFGTTDIGHVPLGNYLDLMACCMTGRPCFGLVRRPIDLGKKPSA